VGTNYSKKRILLQFDLFSIKVHISNLKKFLCSEQFFITCYGFFCRYRTYLLYTVLFQDFRMSEEASETTSVFML